MMSPEMLGLLLLLAANNHGGTPALGTARAVIRTWGNGWLSSHTPSCRCFSADVLKMVDALTWLLLISDPALEVLAHVQVKLALSNLLFPICQATP